MILLTPLKNQNGLSYSLLESENAALSSFKFYLLLIFTFEESRFIMFSNKFKSD